MFADGSWHNVSLSVDAGGRVSLGFDGGYMYQAFADIAGFAIPTPAYLGFTARTGALTNNHLVRAISMSFGASGWTPPDAAGPAGLRVHSTVPAWGVARAWDTRDELLLVGDAGYTEHTLVVAGEHPDEAHQDPNAGVVALLQESGASPAGWSNSEVTDVGSAGLVHGPWVNDVTDVSIDVVVPAGVTTCEVSWRSWAANSRDIEVYRVLINGAIVWSMLSQCRPSGSDGWEQGPPDFPNPWGGQNGQVCFLEVTRLVACSPGTLNIRFQSAIDQGEADESWAFE